MPENIADKCRKGSRGKWNMAKIKCYNCEKMGHFARNCIDPQTVMTLISSQVVLVSSSAYLTEVDPLWIIDLRASTHVNRNREAFVNFHWIFPWTKWIYVGNNLKIEVKGVGTCKL